MKAGYRSTPALAVPRENLAWGDGGVWRPALSSYPVFSVIYHSKDARGFVFVIKDRIVPESDDKEHPKIPPDSLHS